MKKRPSLETERLILRPFALDDAPRVQLLAGDYDIASTTMNIPHPYEDGLAEKWIKTHKERFEEGTLVNFAIVLRAESSLIGAIGLVVNQKHNRAELGYWIGKPYWGNDYCTEAAKEVVHYGFKGLGLNRIFAHHMTRNPASGRIMEKIGMRSEGCFRKYVKKWDAYEDMNLYAILRSELDSSRRNRNEK